MRYAACYVAARPNNIRWLKPFLNKDIGHLSIVYADCNSTAERQVYCMLEPSIYGLQPIVLSAVTNEKELVEWFKTYNFRLLKVKNYDQKKIVITGIPNIFSCVSFIRYAIGIRSWSLFQTPRKLWDKLIKDGSKLLI